MRRIGLFLGVEPAAGGMFQYAQALLDALLTLDTEQRVEAHIAYAHKAWAPVLERWSLPAHQLKMGQLGLSLSYGAMVLRLPLVVVSLLATVNPICLQLRTLKCDAWIFPAQDPSTFQVRERAIGVIHDLMHRYEPHFPEVSGANRSRVREYRYRSIVKSADAILVDSEIGKSQVLECYGADPSRIFPLPYVPSRTILEAGDAEPDVELPERFLFYPAQFWEHKNHRRLLDALARLLALGHEPNLVLSGAKRHSYEAVREHARALGLSERVTFLGYVPDEMMPALYRRARAMVMPTFFGPTNIPPLEAMACGCPVAISGIYGMPEQLGKAALYFDPRSEKAIADACERLWVDDALCARLVEAGRRKTMAWNHQTFADRLGVILEAVFTAARAGSRIECDDDEVMDHGGNRS